MNDARKKVEEFKKNATGDQLRTIAWNVKVEKNNMDYHQYNRAVSIEIDNTVAQKLGVTLTDHETWPNELGQQLAKDWATSLPGT